MAKNCEECPLAIVGVIALVVGAVALLISLFLGIERFSEMSQQLHNLEKYVEYDGSLKKDVFQKELELPSKYQIKFMQDDVDTLLKNVMKVKGDK